MVRYLIFLLLYNLFYDSAIQVSNRSIDRLHCYAKRLFRKTQYLSYRIGHTCSSLIDEITSRTLFINEEEFECQNVTHRQNDADLKVIILHTDLIRDLWCKQILYGYI